ncbi:hypothetical protein [Cohnella terricola]|uniref:Uncharacterized protein n=1 Tax=Cohnella terricola TaxID=1289167 RepID=A0A559JXD3_9BACL|nr:hypothetical protein [Cohnella terricola]TVY04555.1 hypothetical protein FPZ45_02980 [Cohnella terricola]
METPQLEQTQGEQSQSANSQRIQYEITREPEQETRSLPMGVIIVGAVAAALVGAVVWALIAYYGNYELGILASAIGALVGFVVAFLSRKNVTPLHQIIAVIFGLLGVLAGKYITYYLVKQDVEEYLQQLGLSDAGSIISFSDMFKMYDVLWIALAAVAAWTIPQRFSQRNVS